MVLTRFIEPPVEGQSFASFDDWVQNATSALTAHAEYNDTEHGDGWQGYHFKALCFDQAGRQCRNGGDFMRARDEDKFPIWWVWPDQIPLLVKRAGSLQSSVLEILPAFDHYEDGRWIACEMTALNANDVRRFQQCGSNEADMVEKLTVQIEEIIKEARAK